MVFEPNLTEINRLFQHHQLKTEISKFQVMSGTTDGIVLKLESIQGEKMVLKFDRPNEIRIAEQLLTTYRKSELLSKVIYVAPDHSFLIYTYMEGTTHFNRGNKSNWLTKLVKELLNEYTLIEGDGAWGRLGYPRRSWKEFNETSIEQARSHIGNVLTDEDYAFVRKQTEKLFREDRSEEKYLLHGDTGVHNFVFDQSTLVGVIDPSPMIGPLIYDFVYAFCSSPDDIRAETLFTAFDSLKQGRMNRSQLIDEVSVQLYCRIGLSILHHPNDLPEYLLAWKHWRALCQQNEEGIGII